jgi:hypothetical protein
MMQFLLPVISHVTFKHAKSLCMGKVLHVHFEGWSCVVGNHMSSNFIRLSWKIPVSILVHELQYIIAIQCFVMFTGYFYNMKFWEEPITHFLSHYSEYLQQAERKLQYVCVLGVIKHYNLTSCSVGSDLWSTPLKWHDTYTKFHEHWFGHAGNITVITLTTWEVRVLVLLIRTIYDVG